jgi:hypothetical protein
MFGAAGGGVPAAAVLRISQDCLLIADELEDRLSMVLLSHGGIMVFSLAEATKTGDFQERPVRPGAGRSTFVRVALNPFRAT